LPIISSISEEISPNRTVKTVFMSSRLFSNAPISGSSVCLMQWTGL